MIKVRKESDEVFYTEEEHIFFDKSTIQWIKNLCS